MKNLQMIFYYLMLMTLFSPTDAFAYFDPGTGSILLQALAVGLIAVGGFWAKIKHKFLSLFGKSDDKGKK